MRVLGISDHFISGAAVIEDGRVIAAVAEERLARKKMVMGFPRKSIEAVLQIAGVKPDELDRVGEGHRSKGRNERAASSVCLVTRLL